MLQKLKCDGWTLHTFNLMLIAATDATYEWEKIDAYTLLTPTHPHQITPTAFPEKNVGYFLYSSRIY